MPKYQILNPSKSYQNANTNYHTWGGYRDLQPYRPDAGYLQQFPREHTAHRNPSPAVGVLLVITAGVFTYYLIRNGVITIPGITAGTESVPSNEQAALPEAPDLVGPTPGQDRRYEPISGDIIPPDAALIFNWQNPFPSMSASGVSYVDVVTAFTFVQQYQVQRGQQNFDWSAVGLPSPQEIVMSIQQYKVSGFIPYTHTQPEDYQNLYIEQIRLLNEVTSI